jgi:hypothetical protein
MCEPTKPAPPVISTDFGDPTLSSVKKSGARGAGLREPY